MLFHHHSALVSFCTASAGFCVICNWAVWGLSALHALALSNVVFLIVVMCFLLSPKAVKCFVINSLHLWSSVKWSKVSDTWRSLDFCPISVFIYLVLVWEYLFGTCVRFHNGFSNIFVSFLGCCHTYVYVCIIDIVLYMCGHGIQWYAWTDARTGRSILLRDFAHSYILYSRGKYIDLCTIIFEKTWFFCKQ